MSILGWSFRDSEYFEEEYNKMVQKYDIAIINYNTLLDEVIRLNKELQYYKDKYGEKKE